MSTLIAAAALFGTSLACPGGCKLTVYEHRRGKGWSTSYGEGGHGKMGWYNDRTSGVQLTAGCTAELYEHPNFGGNKLVFQSGNSNLIYDIYGIKFTGTNIQMEDKISSVKVYKTGGRRRTEDAFGELSGRDPLCEWILQDGLDHDWAFGTNDMEKAAEIDRLIQDCEDEFSEEVPLAQCKMYVYVIAAYYDSEELINDLKFNPLEETPESEYMRCGLVATKINDAIESGKLSGVKLVEGEDGEDDTFELEEPTFGQDVVYTEYNGAVETLLSVGAMISMAIGQTLVKVCRDFDPVDHHYLLA